MKSIVLFFYLLSAHFSFTQDLVTVENICYNVGDTLEIDEIRFPIHETLYGTYSDQVIAPIDSISDILIANPYMKIRIEDHTDARGSADRNLERSQYRVDKIRTMILKNGVDSIQIIAIGYGEDKPIFEEKYINSFKRSDPNKFKMLHWKNRRTLFIITEI